MQSSSQGGLKELVQEDQGTLNQLGGDPYGSVIRPCDNFHCFSYKNNSFSLKTIFFMVSSMKNLTFL